MPRPKIARTFWALAFVSHALLPSFLTVGLGASVVVVGLIEGVAEAAASILKVICPTIARASQAPLKH
jgi:hypothetical protein